jgi:MutS domain V
MNRLKPLENRIGRLERREETLEVLSKKYWLVRRSIFGAGAVLSLVTWEIVGGKPAVLVAGLFLIAFIIVVVIHNRVLESIKRTRLMLELQEIQIARINLDWNELPQPDHAESQPNHPFEIDIDVTGERSLHRLLDTSVTQEGSRRLRSWLLSSTPNGAVIAKRQSLVTELSRLSLFRDKLHLYAAIVSEQDKNRRVLETRIIERERWDSRILIAWLDYAASKDSLRNVVVLLTLISATNLALFVLAILGLIPYLWPITFLIYVAVMINKQNRIARAWGEVQDLENTLRRFGAVFRYLESWRCAGAKELAQVCAPFLDSQKRPSAELWKIERIAAALGLRTNALLWLIVNALVPWDFFFSYRLERLKSEIRELLPRWLDAWYELEALNSLANFAWLNPHYSFPEVVNNRTVFVAQGLGHPLIKPQNKVCNDFQLGQDSRIVILTGSNMAGKSTFLRSIGLNACLANAGAPVNAKRLQLSLFTLFTCIKVSDSVQDGLSYFYAEVRRLKLLLRAVQQANERLPVLFLIDEIFRGTNNRERHIGSEAFIRALAGQNYTLGLIATHDLELTSLETKIPGIKNFHFREEVGDGRMVFDYLLRPGPCPTTNALKIMSIEGLPV